mmetsp:Transcript_5907/g.9379  ORF Transcript_5907/g.9379 Transcript_5907/m.9379 type:complete len:254 (-) Transcript_5907:1150-1911(-)
MDRDDNGSVDFEEFIYWWMSVKVKEYKATQARSPQRRRLSRVFDPEAPFSASPHRSPALSARPSSLSVLTIGEDTFDAPSTPTSRRMPAVQESAEKYFGANNDFPTPGDDHVIKHHPQVELKAEKVRELFQLLPQDSKGRSRVVDMMRGVCENNELAKQLAMLNAYKEVDKEKIVTAFDNMRQPGKRLISVEDFVSYYGPKGMIRLDAERGKLDRKLGVVPPQLSRRSSVLSTPPSQNEAKVSRLWATVRNIL